MKRTYVFLAILALIFAVSCEKEPNPEDIIVGKFVYSKDGFITPYVSPCGNFFQVEGNNDIPNGVYFSKSQIPLRYRNHLDTIDVEIYYIESSYGNCYTPNYELKYIKEIK